MIVGREWRRTSESRTSVLRGQRIMRVASIAAWGVAVSVLILLAGTRAVSGQKGGPIRVEVTKAGEGYRLLRDGKPFFIKGAGGRDALDRLAAAGANSVRTW